MIAAAIQFPESADTLRQALIGVAYLICAAGVIEAVIRAKNNPAELKAPLISLLIVALLIFSYKDILSTLDDGFRALRNSVVAGQRNSMRNFFLVQISDDTKISLSLFEPKTWIPYFISFTAANLLRVIQILGGAVIALVSLFQRFVIIGLYVVSPLCLSLLSFSFTRQIGVTFCMTSIGVSMWAIGFAVVDICIEYFLESLFSIFGMGNLTTQFASASAGTAIMTATTVAAGMGTAASTGLSIMTAIAIAALGLLIIMALCYCSVPFIVGAILSGKSPAGAMMQGTMGTMGTVAGMMFAANQLSSAAQGAQAAASGSNAPATSLNGSSPGTSNPTQDAQAAQNSGQPGTPPTIASSSSPQTSGATQSSNSNTTSSSSSDTSGTKGGDTKLQSADSKTSSQQGSSQRSDGQSDAHSGTEMGNAGSDMAQKTSDGDNSSASQQRQEFLNNINNL